jgi:lycopene cyclase domain-containing protein
MLETNYLYLSLNIIIVSIPIICAFEHRIRFASSFRHLLPAVAIVGGVFIVWDIWFTKMGVWGFMPQYLTGPSIAGLPLEEWLFFITMPIAFAFIYRMLNFFWPQPFIGMKTAYQLNLFLAFFSAAMVVMHIDKWYTGVTFGLLALYLLFLQYKAKPAWLPHFYRAYLVVLIPFLIVNGILTGYGLDSRVVWYDDAHNIGKRILTIPLEDVFYCMLLTAGIVHLYEHFSKNTYHRL